MNMPTYTLPYGKKTLRLTMPKVANVDQITPKKTSPASSPKELIRASLQKAHLASLADAKSVAIAINDKTRPVPHQHLLPPLLKEIAALGVPSQNITLLIATGAHPPMRKEEFSQVVPAEILRCYRVITHDCDHGPSLIHLGETERGTPVWINRTYAEADVRVVVGNIEPHQFQGFSGGAKSAAIGLAGRETINANHAWMTDPQARLGEYKENPARQDVEAIGDLADIHLALNVIMNAKKKIVRALAGSPRDVMERAIPLVKEIYQVNVETRYDLVIVTPGGHPKDINLYQSQKALAHAAQITRPDGTILLMAACPQGVGEERCEAWLKNAPSLNAILTRFRREGFQLGAHKAYQIARDAVKHKLYLYSEMPNTQVEALNLNPIYNLDAFMAEAGTTNANIALMPYANATIPYLKE